MNPTQHLASLAAVSLLWLCACSSDAPAKPFLQREPTSFAQRNLELTGRGGVAFLGDGRLILSEGERLSATEWPSGRTLGTFARTDAEWTGRLLATTPDGKLLAASLDRPEAIAVFEAASGHELARFELDSDPATALAFAPGGTRLVAGTAGGQVEFFDLPTGGKPPAAPRSRPHAATASPVTFVAFASDEIALSSALEGSLRGWDALHASPLWTMADARGLALDAAGGRLVLEHAASGSLELFQLAGRTAPRALRKLMAESPPSAERRACLLPGELVAYTNPEEFVGVGWQDLVIVSLGERDGGRARTSLRLGSPRAFAVDPEARYLIVSDGGQTFAYDLKLVLAP